MANKSPFRYLHTSPEVIRLAVMMHFRFPLSLRKVEGLLHERGIDVSYESVRFWWQSFGPKFASEILKKRTQTMRHHMNWKWHLDEMFVRCCQTNSNPSPKGQRDCPLFRAERAPLSQSSVTVHLEI
jgi:putative transposase